MEKRQRKVDLHFHTVFSFDSCITLQQAIKMCNRKGIDCVAITDHNEMSGAIKLAKMAPFEVIVGEEIKTKQGEIIGLFLKEKVPPCLDISETIRMIKSQNGLVYLPHPYKMDRETIIRNINSIDIIEVYNGRSLKMENNAYAFEIAYKYGKPMAAGSDAHTPFEIGNAYVEMEPFEGRKDFLDKLKKGRIRGRVTPIWLRVLMNRYTRKGLRFLLRNFG